MLWNGQPRLRVFLYILLFVAATFAVIYFSFWTEEGTVSRKPVPPDTSGSSAPATSGNGK